MPPAAISRGELVYLVQELVSVQDPEVDGVTVYITDFKRSLADKLSRNFFSEPSQASVTCAATGPVVIKDVKKISGPEGSEVFSEQKGLNFFQNKVIISVLLLSLLPSISC